MGIIKKRNDKVHSLSTNVRKILKKTNISYPLIRTRTSDYLGVRSASFLENFVYVLNA